MRNHRLARLDSLNRGPFFSAPNWRSHATIAGLILLLVGCGAQYRTGTAQVRDGAKSFALTGVHRNRALVYAFVWPTDIPKNDTNDSRVKPGRGIHFFYNADDGLWFNGVKVAFPKESKVFALARDGKAIPISLTHDEVQQVSELTTPRPERSSVPEGELKQKLLAPFKTEAAAR